KSVNSHHVEDEPEDDSGLHFQPEPPVIKPSIKPEDVNTQTSVQAPGVDNARDAVMSALSQDGPSNIVEPRTDLNALPLSMPAPSSSSPLDNYRLPSSDPVA